MTRVRGSNDAREKDEMTRVEQSIRRCRQDTPDVSQICHSPHGHHPPSGPVKSAAHPQALLLFRHDRLRGRRLQVLTKRRPVRRHANAHTPHEPNCIHRRLLCLQGNQNRLHPLLLSFCFTAPPLPNLPHHCQSCQVVSAP